ncbi:MAG: protein TolQ [Coxiellaceae bacterium]|nr:protein TolQ [Coxiellaceae bacterium]
MLQSETSIWSFIIHAGPVVKLVMLILLLASVSSWTIIIQRVRLYKQRRKEARQFEERFWSGSDLNNIYDSLHSQRKPVTGLAKIFYSGFSEYLKSSSKSNNKANVIKSTQRAMRIAQSHEVDNLEKHLSFLATVGSNSVYIGLFGTVWGIMSAFRGLGAVQQATIAMVAPGISEALIATAMGLVAAIPAVIAYNFFTSQLERLDNSYQTFQDEFSSVLHHQSKPQTHAPSDESNEGEWNEQTA